MSNKMKFKGKTLYTKTCVDNILKMYEIGDRKHRDWYVEASEWAITVADATGFAYGRVQVCAVIAALSPQKSWDENKKLAYDFIVKGKRSGHTKVMIQKAKDCLATKDVEDHLDILNGEKIKSFYLNLRYPYRRTGVTVDRHAIEIALGYISDGHQMTVRQYQFFEKCYVVAAQKLECLPHQLQAVTWEAWRTYKKQLK